MISFGWNFTVMNAWLKRSMGPRRHPPRAYLIYQRYMKQIDETKKLIMDDKFLKMYKVVQKLGTETCQQKEKK